MIMKVILRTHNNILRRIRAGLVITNQAQECDVDAKQLKLLEADALLHIAKVEKQKASTKKAAKIGADTQNAQTGANTGTDTQGAEDA